MKSHGFLEICRSEEGGTTLLPPTMEYTGESGLLPVISLYLEPGVAESVVTRAAELRDILSNVSGAKVPGEDEETTSKWVLENYPGMATGFTMVKVVRELQQSAGQLCQTFLSAETKDHEFLVGGFGQHATALNVAIDSAVQLSSSSGETQLSLHGNNVSGEKEVAQLLLPHVQAFQEVLPDAQRVRDSIAKAGGAKGGAFLEGPKTDCQKTWAEDFRVWAGVHSRATRSLTKIADEVLAYWFCGACMQ